MRAPGVVVGVALIVIGGIVVSRDHVYASVRVVALAAVHHWPVTLIAVGALVLAGTLRGGELDPRTNQRARTVLLVGLVGLVGFVVILGVLALLLGPVTAWVAGPHVEQLHGKDLADAVNAVRQTVLATAAGLAAVVGLGFTARTFYLSRRGQVTDRYAKAVALLASDKMAERVGGVYALEHVMRESAVDHDTVVNLLAAFVRERAPATAIPPATVGPTGADAPKQEELQLPPTDVQTAVTVLARRPNRTELQPLDLSRTHLGRADLTDADLTDANLTGANLTGANLTGANLTGANLTGANLTGANLASADLSSANLARAKLTDATLTDATLTRADLTRANATFAVLAHAILFRANLTSANLGCANLTGANLTGASLTDATLTRADLTGANVGSADLTGAILGRAVLTGAVLARADLTGANVTGADLTGAVVNATQLTVAVLDGSTMVDASLRVALNRVPGSGPELSSQIPTVGSDPPQPAP